MESGNRANSGKNKRNRAKPANNHSVKQSDLYVGVSEPLSVHRSLLEMQRDVVLSLKRFEQVHLLRKEKVKELMSLRRSVSQASSALAQLKLELPHVEGHFKQEKEAQVQPSAQIQQTPAHVHANELHRLDRELSDIESKLKEL